jgi:hypothetical protein
MNSRSSQRGFLEVDLLVGLAILTIAILPLAYSFAEYSHSMANEIIDGEMEILLAGGGKTLPEGSQTYAVNSRAAAGLPPGHFQLTKNGSHLRLEWQADPGKGIGLLVREGDMR